MEHLLDTLRRNPDARLSPELSRLIFLHGVPGRSSYALVRTTKSQSDLDRLSFDLARDLADTRHGLFCATSHSLLSGQKYVAIVKLSAAGLIAPIPRAPQGGAEVDVALDFFEEQAEPPIVLMDGANGSVKHAIGSPSTSSASVVLKSAKATKFRVRFVFDASPGWSWINVAVDRGRTRSMVLGLPIWSGAAPLPNQPPSLAIDLGGNEVLEAVLERVNRERAAKKLKAFSRSTVLDSEAEQDVGMMQSGLDPSLRDPSPNVTRSFMDLSRGWTNASSEAEIAGQFIKLPFYRRAYLSPSATKIGARVDEGDTGMIAAFIVAAQPARLSSTEARSRVEALVKKRRTEKKLRRLRWSSSATRRLQSEADALCATLSRGGKLPDDALGELNQRLVRSPIVPPGRSSVISAVVVRPHQFEQIDPFLSNEAGRDTDVGAVAGCQGDFPDYGDGYVLLLFHGVGAQK